MAFTHSSKICMTCSIMGHYEWRCSIINQKIKPRYWLHFIIYYLLSRHAPTICLHSFLHLLWRSCYSDCSFYCVLLHLTPFVSFCCLACAEVSTKTRVSFKCQFVTISPTIKVLIIGYRNFYLSSDLKRHKDYLMHIENTGIIFLRWLGRQVWTEIGV